MEFAILGPLEVCHGGRRIDIARPQRRTVLGYLLSRVNRAVSTNELIDAVWGDAPPRTAQSQVHAIVSALRRSLSPAGWECLRSDSAGYTLHADDEQLDAARFRRHVVQARGLAERGVDREAAHELRAGLALWRGDTLAGIDAPFVWALRAGAEEERFTACEMLADIEIKHGRHQEVIPDLAGWLERFPTRESIAERLVVALCRSGRQADALEVVRRLRIALADELGIDLGPGLADLQTRVLAMDPDLFGLGSRLPDIRWSPEAGPAPGFAPPAQLPPAAKAFVGRCEELARLADHLVWSTGETPVALISGMAGAGKTAFATYLGHQVAADFPEGQIYLNLRGAGSPAFFSALDALTVMLVSLNVPMESIPGDVDSASALLRSTLRTARVLVILDDAASAAQIRPLLPAAPGCAVIVTSRSPLAAMDGVVRVSLPPFGPADGRALLAAIVGEERVAAEETAAADLVDVCGGLPLALRVVAARLLARPLRSVQSVLDQLRVGASRLNGLDYDDLSVRRSLDVAYLPLVESKRPEDGLAAVTLRRMGALNLSEYSVPLVGHLLGSDATTAEAALERLADLNLVEETRHGRYSLHDLVRDYVNELVTSHADPVERPEALSLALCWYKALAGGAVHALVPATAANLRAPLETSGRRHRFANATAALRWFDGELDNLRRLVDQCHGVETYPELSALVRMLYPALRRRARTQELRAFNTQVLEQAVACGDRAGQAQALNDLAEAHHLEGRSQDALPLLEEACRLWAAVGDADRRPYSLASLGGNLAALRRGDEAIIVLGEALELAQRQNDRAVEASILGALGFAHLRTDAETAIGYHLRSLEAGKSIHSDLLQLAAHANIGSVYMQNVAPAKALDHYERALAITQASDEGWYNERQVRVGICDALRHLGRHDEAARQCLALLADARIHEDRYAEGTARYHYGHVLQAQQRPEEAAVHWRAALDVLQDCHVHETVEELRSLLQDERLTSRDARR